MSSSERLLATQDREPGARGYRVNLPFVSAEFHATRVSMPHVPMPRVPNRRAIGDTVGAGRERLLSPGRVAFYGGLAAMTALQLIEWPVAVALGVGMAVASRGGGDKLRDKEAAATGTVVTDKPGGTAPAVGETAPAVGETAPAVGETAPAAGETASAGGETVPAAGGKAATAKGARATTPTQRAKRGTSAVRASTT